MPEQLSLPSEGLLLAISQIGLALGGFAGLLASFWPSEHGRALRRSPALTIILDFTFAALAFGLFPFAVHLLTGDQTLTWRVCSLLLAGFVLLELILWLRRILRGVRPVYPKTFYIGFVLVGAVVAVAEIVNGVSYAMFNAYAIGLMWLLVPPVIQFYLFIVDQDLYLQSAQWRKAGDQIAGSGDDTRSGS